MTTKAKSNVKKEEELPECFIIMPISDPDSYNKGHFKNVYEHIIKPACSLAKYESFRADDNKSTNMIHEVILKRILNAPMAICDLSSLNPNVMFELGIRQAFDMPVVLIQEKGTKHIFDLAPIKTIEYPKGMVYHEVIEFHSLLSETITSTFEESKQPDNSNSIVKYLALQSAAQLPDITGNENNLAINSLHSEIGSLRKLVEQQINQPIKIRNEYIKEESDIFKRLVSISNHINLSSSMFERGSLDKELHRAELQVIIKEIENLLIDPFILIQETIDARELLERCTRKLIKIDNV